MATNSATVDIGLNTNRLQNGANKALGLVQGMKKKMEGALSGVGRDILGGLFGAGLLNVTKDAVKSAAAFEGMQNSMASLMGSSELATAEIERLREAALLPGLDFENAVKGSSRLQAVGLSAEEARDLLKELGNVSALSGLSASDFGEIVDAISDIGSSGDITDEKIDRLTERSGILSKVLKETFGASNAAGIREMGVSADEFLSGLTKGLSTLDRTASDSLANTLKNSDDQIKQLSTSIGTQLMPAVTTALEGFNEILNVASNVWGSIESQLETISAMTAGLSYADAVKETNALRDSEKKLAEESLKASEARKAAQDSAKKSAPAKKKDSKDNTKDFESARSLFELETRILELKNAGTRAANKQASELEKQAKMAALIQQIMKQQNVSGQEAIRIAERRYNAENKSANSRIKGYSNAQRANNPYMNQYRGLDSLAKMQKREEGQFSNPFINRMKFSALNNFYADRNRPIGAPLTSRAEKNATEAPVTKTPEAGTLESIDQHLKTIVEAVR